MMDLPINYDKARWSDRKKAREEYAIIQEGKCWYCGEPLDEDPSDEVVDAYITESIFPNKFFKWPVHLHHDHETGLTKGAVHARCNAYLFQYLGE